MGRSRPNEGVLTRCEVVAIGTELLPGQTVDTNPSWMGAQPGIGGSNLSA